MSIATEWMGWRSVASVILASVALGPPSPTPRADRDGVVDFGAVQDPWNTDVVVNVGWGRQDIVPCDAVEGSAHSSALTRVKGSVDSLVCRSERTLERIQAEARFDRVAVEGSR